LKNILVFKYFIFFIFSICGNTDSLVSLLNKEKSDNRKFDLLIELNKEFLNTDTDSAVYYLTLAEKIINNNPGNSEWNIRKSKLLIQKGWIEYIQNNYLKAKEFYSASIRILDQIKNASNDNDSLRMQSYKILAENYLYIGFIHHDNTEYNEALNFFYKSLDLYKKTSEKKGLATVYGSIGSVYCDFSDYNKALDYLFKALKLDDELGNVNYQIRDMTNIGLIYFDKKNYNLALKYLGNAYALSQKINFTRAQQNLLTNMALIYKEKKEFYNAIEKLQNSLEICKKINFKRGIVNNLINLSMVYNELNELYHALNYLNIAFEKNQELENSLFSGIIHQLYGDIFIKLGKWDKAMAHLKNAENILIDTKNIFYLKDVYMDFYTYYEKNKNYKKAFEYYKKFINLTDSINNQENNKKSIITDLKYNHEKEQALKEAYNQKQLAVEKEAKEKQTIITWSVTAGLVLVILFLGFVVNRLNLTRKQKNIIENQKEIVEMQKQIVEEQKKIVEQKNKDILDSINYARRIQNAILPSIATWKQHLPKSFVLYLPKDVIAGDFYWMEVLDNYIYVAAADCTGHGVSGAMVSVVCANALTKAVLEEKLTDTDKILNKTRELVIEKLTSEENIRDGMDICLIRINRQKNQIQYSGANRPLYVVIDGNLQEYKPDKQPIGRFEESKPFTKQEIKLTSGTALYLTTDGYADQFGGDKGKKIGTKLLKELLKENSRIGNSEEMHEHLLRYFHRWKGSEEQLDDVTIIQIRT
jgi:serine phosphatase RsbU (regulator of sigma subunit)